MITNNLDDYHDIKHEFAYNQFQELTPFQLNIKAKHLNKMVEFVIIFLETTILQGEPTSFE